jgi:hypothetical protein
MSDWALGVPVPVADPLAAGRVPDRRARLIADNLSRHRGDAVSDQLQALCFQQLHIDIARNTTDDFNPFHDPKRWHRVVGNPFGSTIALGFQTEFLVSDRIEQRHRGRPLMDGRNYLALPFSNYDFKFVGALRPGERFDLELRKTVDKTSTGGGLSTRAMVRKADGSPVLMGSQSETTEARFLGEDLPLKLPVLRALPDRAPVPGTPYFLKRKFLTTSNGKNFVLAGLGTQQDYFDEIDEFVSFPPMFTAALVSCALLEKAMQEGYDFLAEPVVYATHQISVDRRLQSALRSNDRLHLLVDGPREQRETASGAQQTYRVFGLLDEQQVLFRARLQLARLAGK